MPNQPINQRLKYELMNTRNLNIGCTRQVMFLILWKIYALVLEEVCSIHNTIIQHVQDAKET